MFTIDLHLDAAFRHRSSFYLITGQHLYTHNGVTADSLPMKHAVGNIFLGESNQVEAAFAKDGDIYFIHSEKIITRFYVNDGKWMILDKANVSILEWIA